MFPYKYVQYMITIHGHVHKCMYNDTLYTYVRVYIVTVRIREQEVWLTAIFHANVGTRLLLLACRCLYIIALAKEILSRLSAMYFGVNISSAYIKSSHLILYQHEYMLLWWALASSMLTLYDRSHITTTVKLENW